MTGLPTGTVEIAFTAGVYTDVTQYVDGPLTWRHGRPDEFGQPQPGRMAFPLNNRDGRFTAGLASSPYYPNVKPGREVRFSITLPAVNLIGNPSFETNTAGWAVDGGALTRDATLGQHGTASGKYTWITGAAFSQDAYYTVTGLTVGRQYTASAYVQTTAGPRLRLQVTGKPNTTQSVIGAGWQRLTFTFTATSTSHNVVLINVDAATAGQTSWIDAVQLEEGPTASTFTTTGATAYRRFTGYIDEWPTEWPGGGDENAVVQITATDRFARLARSRKLRGLLQEEVLYSGPEGFWPLGDPDGSTSASDISGVAPPLTFRRVGMVGSYEFGAGTGPGGDALPALVLTPTTAQGYYLAAVASGVGESQSMQCWINTTRSGTPQGVIFLRDPIYYLACWMNTTGQVVVRSYPHTIADLVSPATYNDGLTHQVTVTRTRTGDSFTTKLYVDGLQRATNTTALAGHAVYTPTAVYVGGSWPANTWPPFQGTISNASIFNGALTAAQVLTHYQAGTTAGFGETTDARITRWARYLGITSGSLNLDVGAGLMGAQQASGADVLSLMQEAATVENGVLYMAGDNRIRLRNRAVRYNSTAVFSVDAQDCKDDLKAVTDTSYLYNEVEFTRPGGATIRRTNTASVAEYGAFTDQVTLPASTDDEVAAHAEWRIANYSEPAPRLSSVSIDLLSHPQASLIAAVVGADVSNKFTVTGLPAQAHATSADLFVEGVGETFGEGVWTVSFDTSPGTIGAEVLELEHAVYGELDAYQLAL